MKSLELLLPLTVISVLGAPEPLVLQALRFACIEFCRRTEVVQRLQVPTNVVAGTQDYVVTVPADMELVRVLGAAYQGFWLTPVAPDDVRSDTALRGADVGIAKVLTGAPQFFFQKQSDLDTISLYPVPDTSVAGGLLVKAAFCPTTTAATVEDQLVDDWAEGIAAGAVARVQSLAGQAFSADPTAARKVFEMAVSSAKRQKMVGKQAAALRVQPRGFA